MALGVQKELILPKVEVYGLHGFLRLVNLARVDDLLGYLRQHGDASGVHLHYVELCDRKRMREDVLCQLVTLFLQRGGLLEASLLQDVLVLVISPVVKAEFVHPPEAAHLAVLAVSLRRLDEEAHLGHITGIRATLIGCNV
jgi:hypothetical protein